MNLPVSIGDQKTLSGATSGNPVRPMMLTGLPTKLAKSNTIGMNLQPVAHQSRQCNYCQTIGTAVSTGNANIARPRLPQMNGIAGSVDAAVRSQPSSHEPRIGIL